jgi:hypothetical protein
MKKDPLVPKHERAPLGAGTAKVVTAPAAPSYPS